MTKRSIITLALVAVTTSGLATRMAEAQTSAVDSAQVSAHEAYGGIWMLQAVDVLPTVAHALGMEMSWTTDGRPAQAAIPPGVRHVYLDRARQPFAIAPGSFERSLAEAQRWKHAVLGSDVTAVAGRALVDGRPEMPGPHGRN